MFRRGLGLETRLQHKMRLQSDIATDLQFDQAVFFSGWQGSRLLVAEWRVGLWRLSSGLGSCVHRFYFGHDNHLWLKFIQSKGPQADPEDTDGCCHGYEIK